MESIYDIVKHFDYTGNLKDVKEFGSGHINKTYIVTFENNGVDKLYVLQQLNGDVFKNIDELMDNVFAVTSYLRKQIKSAGGNPERETLHFIRTKKGYKYYKSDDGSFYRTYVFVDNSVSYDSVDSADVFKSSGIAFGKFQRMLDGFDADLLYETIPNFHDTRWRYVNEFLPAVKDNLSGRKDTCLKEIEFVNNHSNVMGKLVDMVNDNKLPIRVTHNDTKLNNVMFDKDTNECVCVIDLDTVMPGLALYDFGDSIRFGANTADEDEADLSKVSIDLDYFKAYAEGFLQEAGSAFNQYEIDNLAFAAMLMTLECGMRFLTDYLNGDTYFKTDYPQHNLVRAKNQFKLVADMENNMQQMQDIIKSI